MCTVLGFEKMSVSEKEAFELLERTRSRGPDGARIVKAGQGLLGFNRLSIIGIGESGMQPFEHKGLWAVCNGEIYGFEEIRESLKGEYEFKGHSDCEVILPLYEKYGTDMFDMLSAEFAMIIHTPHEGMVAARDPIGIRPLFYGKDRLGGMVFASQALNLLGVCGEIRPFPPGCYYRGGRFIRYADLAETKGYITGSLDSICPGIRQRLEYAVKRRLVSDVPLGFLLSGGLDSSLVCAIAAKMVKEPIHTFAIGMDKDAIDLKYARRAAEYIGAEHTEVIITKEDVIKALPEVIKALGTWDITTIRAGIGMYLCCKAIHEQTDIRVILTGEVSDELFGYKYTDFAPSPKAFQAEAQKRVRELYMYDVLRADRCISTHSLEGRVPFGDRDFVSYVMSIDPALKMNIYQKGKYLLRYAFKDSGLLPDDILWREKAAFSDGVGHSMVDDLKDYAESVISDEDFEKGCASFDYCPPFTKESLLYRLIFEKYYPRQARMIKDFWMPNKAWEGCDVDDPSARVLSNYGASRY